MRVPAGVRAGETGHVHVLEHQSLDVLTGAIAPQWLCDDVAHGHARIQGAVGVLENHLHAPSQGPKARLGQRADLTVPQMDRTGRHRFQSDDRASGRGLAAARLTNQPERFARFQMEIDAVHGAYRAGQATEDPGADRKVHRESLHGEYGRISHALLLPRDR